MLNTLGMQTTTVEVENGRERYVVIGCLDGRDAGRSAWYVIDSTRFLGPRRIGSGERAFVEARWLARILNGVEAERAQR